MAYIDIGSGCVFKESQTCPLRPTPTTATATGVRDGLASAVGRTYPGGPPRIQLNGSEAGDPVDVNVTIGFEASQESTLLGHTDSDGTLWTASPSVSYIVTVIKGNLVVALTADPALTLALAANPTDTENGTSPTVMSTPTESIESSGPPQTVPQGVPGDSPTIGLPTVG